MAEVPRGRAVARRVLRHPLSWTVVCLAAAVPLMGTPYDFGGFLLSLLAGWLAAHALVRLLLVLRPPWLSVALHVGASLAIVVPMLIASSPGGAGKILPAPLTAAIGLALPPAAGWIWLTLIGRASGAVRADERRRAAQRTEPEWRRDASRWTLRLPVVPLRRSAYLAVGIGLFVLATGIAATLVIVFEDVAQRLGPMAILLVLGWTVFLPISLVLHAVARVRTVEVSLVVDERRMRVLPVAGRAPLFDAPLEELRSVTWRLRTSPTGVVLRPAAGPGLVLLVGMARREKGRAATCPPPPATLLRMLDGAGLLEKPSRRPRAEELRVERVQHPASSELTGGRGRPLRPS